MEQELSVSQEEEFAQAIIPTQEEEIAHAVYNNYFPEGTDIDYLTDEFYDGLEQ